MSPLEIHWEAGLVRGWGEAKKRKAALGGSQHWEAATMSEVGGSYQHIMGVGWAP